MKPHYFWIISSNTTKQKKTRPEAIKECSSALRKMAINNGLSIDNSYRNEAGIGFQMASMESAFVGTTIVKPATQLFKETVRLYKEQPRQYETLLSEAKSMIVLPERADTRDSEAIRRLCTAYMKLLFPHIRDASEMSPFEFDCYCLQPAKEMRSIIRIQMGLVDSNETGKSIPDVHTRGM